MIGISLAYLPGKDLAEVTPTFLSLQQEFRLEACELHLECNEFAAALDPAYDHIPAEVEQLRARLKMMGVHLPYLDLNPISDHPLVAQFALGIYSQAIKSAAAMRADYVVFHARGNQLRTGDRQAELRRWQQVAAQLAEIAQAHRISFCLENADDVRLLNEVDQIRSENQPIDICLDIGHLFERVKRGRIGEQLIGRLADRCLPWQPLWGQGIPFYAIPIWNNWLDHNAERIRCIHVHNHNGKMAHGPLSSGKIDVARMLRSLPAALPESVPVIIEADYRQAGLEPLRRDLAFLEEIWGK